MLACDHRSKDSMSPFWESKQPLQTREAIHSVSKQKKAEETTQFIFCSVHCRPKAITSIISSGQASRANSPAGQQPKAKQVLGEHTGSTLTQAGISSPGWKWRTVARSYWTGTSLLIQSLPGWFALNGINVYFISWSELLQNSYKCLGVFQCYLPGPRENDKRIPHRWNSSFVWMHKLFCTDGFTCFKITS